MIRCMNFDYLICGTLTQPFRNPKVIQQHLDFYNGILKFIPGLQSSLDSMSAPLLSKIIQAVRSVYYMRIYV